MRNSARILCLTTTFFATISCQMVFGQAKGGGTVGSPGVGNNTPTTNTPTINNTNQTPNQQTVPSSISRPMYVSGRISMDDGTALPASISVVRVCNGVTRVMGYPDSNGNFSFDMNHADNAFQDASTSATGNPSDPTNTRASLDDPLSQMRGGTGSGLSNMGSNSNALLGCELRAQMAGFRSGTIQLAQRRSLDDPNVGTIFLHRMSKEEGTTVSMTSLTAPKDAKKAFEKGLEALKKKKSEEAEKDFEKAVATYPQYADAWYRLGALQKDEKNLDAARTSFHQAITADPKLVTPYVELALLDGKEGKWKETAESTGKAIRLDPVDFPVAFYFDAVANYNLQNFEAAEKSARQLQRLDTEHRYPMADRILASVLADKKDYSGAAQQMREYLKVAGNAKDADEVRGQLQQLEKMMAQASTPPPSDGSGSKQ